tara:strand:+ start:176 stop:373 length:198 start_codon:yes stop_codon:yes gene_type:complete
MKEMTKKEFLNALGTIYNIFDEGGKAHYDNVGKKGFYTEKELSQAYDLLSILINDAKNKLKKEEK